MNVLHTEDCTKTAEGIFSLCPVTDPTHSAPRNIHLPLLEAEHHPANITREMFKGAMSLQHRKQRKKTNRQGLPNVPTLFPSPPPPPKPQPPSRVSAGEAGRHSGTSCPTTYIAQDALPIAKGTSYNKRVRKSVLHHFEQIALAFVTSSVRPHAICFTT